MKSKKNRKDWLALKTPFKEDLAALWGENWGCDSETGTLRAVLLRRPGPEIEGIKDPAKFRWLDVMDPDKARRQHDCLADLYRSQGVTVHYVENMRPDRPNALFLRDNILMTPEGAVVGRQAMACRRGEERYAAHALAELGVPILRTISGEGIFETACSLWVNGETVIIGTGNRANSEGARQLSEILLGVGVRDFLNLPIPFGYAHIDSIVSFIDQKTAMIDPQRTPWDLWAALRDRGFTLLEAPAVEETADLALNFVALSPGRIVMASGYPATKNFLKNNGVEVLEIDISELRKGWGSLHCMTVALKRDPIRAD